MRKIVFGGALLVLSAASAVAQPWYGPYDRGYGPPRYHRPPPRAYGPPPPRCFIRETPWGPRRVCRDW